MALIDRSAWSANLTPAERDRVFASARGATYRSGESIAVAGLAAEYWVGIIDGFAVQSVVAQDGNEMLLFAASEGTWFGEGTLIKREAWRYDAIAIRTTRVALLPATVFHRLRETSLAFNHALQAALNDRLAVFTELAVTSRIACGTERVASALRRLAVRGRPINISQTELGMLAGLSRQRTNRALRDLSMSGAITVGRDGITVTDMAGLLAMRSSDPARETPMHRAPAESP